VLGATAFNLNNMLHREPKGVILRAAPKPDLGRLHSIA
jgi:hypothetical protein